ncbi:MAG: PH domain-containing protein [Candidatus Binatia bacterium]
MSHFRAPWSTSLIATSVFASLLCIGVSYTMRVVPGKELQPFLSLMSLLPLGVIAISALFTVRGYVLTSDALLVQRLLWTTRLSLADLESAVVDPDAMRRSIRLFGNGGFFSFTGYFRNRHLGMYRALVTNPHQTVVLRYPKKTVVVSPDRPATFVTTLQDFRHTLLARGVS